MNIEIAIIWYNHNIVEFWFGNKLIWKTEFKQVNVEELKKTKLLLPLTEAIKFSLTFISGISADYLTLLVLTIQAKIDELKKMQIPLTEEKEKPKLMSFEGICNGKCNECNEYEKCDNEIAKITNAKLKDMVDDNEEDGDENDNDDWD